MDHIWNLSAYSWPKQNSLSFTVHLYNLNYAPTPKDKRNVVFRGCLPTFSTREEGWEKPIVFKTYQSSGSQSRNPLANGLLAIFNCVIWLRKKIRTIISMYMHQTPVQHFRFSTSILISRLNRNISAALNLPTYKKCSLFKIGKREQMH